MEHVLYTIHPPTCGEGRERRRKEKEREGKRR
jgi:hypothetical protein